MKRICWLVGHTEVFNDSGFPVCSCGAHGYYEEQDWNRSGVLYLPVHWYRIAKHGLGLWFARYFHRCGECGEFSRFFGRSVGDHGSCLPF